LESNSENPNMKKFKKVLVGLDLSPMDEILIKKTAKLVHLLEMEMVYFVHVADDLTISEEIKKSYPGLSTSGDEEIEKEITAKIHQLGFPQDAGFEVEAKEGNPLETILRWSKIKDVDLIVLGRKHDMKGSGSLAKRIAHKSPCSVLFLTEDVGDSFLTPIMVPIDFSFYSMLALDLAKEISQDMNDVKCYHVYEVPSGYSKTGKSYEEFRTIMLHNAKEDYQKFIAKNNLPEYDCNLILREKGNRAVNLIHHAKKDYVGLIVIGSRGRTDSAALLIGSVAEKLITLNNEIPMLILKKKGENMHFLEALFQV
jgi:nucleotide-binding universal stress UspA family protein